MPEHSGAGDISRSLALMWEYDAKPGRGPKPSLSLDQIVDRAIEIADAEGLDAVSMRRVATDLGVGTMSLYRYLPGKEELLDLMLERVSAPDPEELPADWFEAMEALGRGLWRLYTRHPWLPFVDQTRPLLGPNALRGMELILGSLQDVPLTDQQKILMVSTVDVFVSGAARAHSSGILAESRTGVTNEEFWQAQEPILTKAMSGGAYPLLTSLDEDAWAADGVQSFEFGLAVVLEGLRRLVEGR
jgi:AcrR family transcriptional regulator